MILRSSCPPLPGTLSSLTQWLSRLCKETGLSAPLVVLWPGQSFAKYFDGVSWNNPSTLKPTDKSLIPKKNSSFPYHDCTWLRASVNAQVHKQLAGKTAIPCWVGSDLLAMVAFGIDKNDPDHIEFAGEIGGEFADALEALHTVEMLKAHVRGLTACLKFSDRSFTVATALGRVLAATSGASALIGKAVYGESFSSFRDQEIKTLPENIQSGLRNSHSQISIDSRTTAAIEPWRADAITTMPPLYQVEILQEPDAARRPLALSKLSYCEKQVFDLLVQGRSNKEIATVRRCSLSTIRHQVASTFGKLNVHRREELIAAFHSKSAPLHVPGLGAVAKIQAPFVGQASQVRRYIE